MITISPLFSLGIKMIGLMAIAVILFSTNVALGTTEQEEQEQQPESDAPLAMIGQQYFADGTGIAYFNDGTTQEFEHTLSADDGYYFNESTPFYIGAVPGVGNNTGSVECGEPTSGGNAGQAAPATSPRTMPSLPNENSTVRSGNITNVTIIKGASILEDSSRAVDPSPIITIKVNDTVQWINQDTASHALESPPITVRSSIEPSTIIGESLPENGGTVSCTFSEPGGYHYTLRPVPPTGTDRIKGAVIVTEENTTATTPTEQGQEQPSSSSPFSQQLQQ